MNAVTTALLSAIDEVCDDLPAIAATVNDPVVTEADRHARRQFLHAFAALMREALEGGREQRELVLQTAVPALLANGRTSLGLLRGLVALYMALAPHLLAAVPEDLRADASTWLAGYGADFTHDVVEVALEVEGR